MLDWSEFIFRLGIAVLAGALIGLERQWRVYRFRATARGRSEAHVRALLLQSISGHGYQLRAIESVHVPDTDLVEVSAELVTVGRNDEQIETAAGRLGLEPNVTAVRWQAVERNGSDGDG
jgi:putative Mg2+ transporter-C (MgtC) family protein